MPRYYCDYCDTYLTHDSPSVRKQHNAGYKHKANVRAYYQQFEEQQTQSLIDQRVKEHLGQTFQQQMSAAFQQNLVAMQSGQRPMRPTLPPTLPVPGVGPQQMPPSMRPPILQRPPVGPGFSMPMGSTPILGPPGATPSPAGIAQPNGLPRPLTLAPPGSTAPRPSNPTSSPLSNGHVPNGSVLPSSATYNYSAPQVNYAQQNSAPTIPNLNNSQAS